MEKTTQIKETSQQYSENYNKDTTPPTSTDEIEPLVSHQPTNTHNKQTI